MQNENVNAKFLEEYKKNFLQIHNEKDDFSLKETEQRLEKETFIKYTSGFFIFSIIYSLMYFLIQIIFLRAKDEMSTIFYLTIGLLTSYLIMCKVFYFVDLRGCFKVNFNILTFISYLYIFLDILIVSAFSYSTKEVSANLGFYIYVYDFNLVISGSLVILSCEFRFLLKNKLIFISYLISIIGLIIFRAYILMDFMKLAYSISISGFLFALSFYLKKRMNLVKDKCAENSNDTNNVFNHFNSITKVLNAGIFLFRKKDFFYANEVGKSLLEKVSIRPLGQISFQGKKNSLDEIRPINSQVDIKVSMSDSKINLDRSHSDREIHLDNPQEENSLNKQKEAKILFENIFLNEEISNISETVFQLNRKKTPFDVEVRLGANIPLNNISENKETRLNLYSIFSCLNQAKNNSLNQFKDYLKIGIFEFQNKGTKCYYKILVKVHCSPKTNSSEERVIEFVFQDVTQHYNQLSKIEENELYFKKNAHELKTPILSLLGCAEEVKFRLNMIEDLLPESEKIIINKYLDHMANLGSYTEGLIIDLTKNNKEINQPNSLARYKRINLNSLLNLSFSILQTLICCDSQKLEHVKTYLHNEVYDYDVSFESDEIQVKQILLNFISNSAKSTNRGSITVEAKLAKENHHDVLEIKIKDTGYGIKQEEKYKLFQEYCLLLNTGNNAYGLDLNICKSMADKLNIKIELNSEENKGTEVILSIFNPKVNRKEILQNFRKQSEITDNTGDFTKITSLLSTSVNITNNTYSRILDENEINIVKEKANDKYYDTLVNQVASEINNSLLLSLRKTKSSPAFGINANNIKSTERLEKNSEYDRNYSQRTFPSEKLPEVNLHKQPIISLKSKTDQFLSLNFVPKIPSKLNQGTNYENSISLRPKKINIKNLGEPSNSISSTKLISKNPLSAEKILIVSDQLHARRALVNLVTKHCKESDINYDIIEGYNGIDCLNTMIKNPFNIRYIFIEENMNYMNGAETAKNIRELSKSGKIGKINLILTTAHNNISYQTDLFDFCVTKPLTKCNIQEILTHVDYKIS